MNRFSFGRLLLVLFALVASCSQEAPAPPPAPEVVVAAVVQRDVPITREWIGTTQGAVDAEIRAEVSGYLISRDYDEGTFVEKGKLLFQIDPRSFEAALESARGDLGRAQAMLEKARLDVERYTPLVKEGAVSQQELDNAVQARLSGLARVQSARAALDKAQLDLERTAIRSPIDGIASVARAQLGDLVGPGDAEPLTSVSQVDPIRVSFPLAEREYLGFVRGARDGSSGRDPAADADRLELVLADGSIWPKRGRVVPAAAGVDPRTGTILVRGEFANPDRVLRPGQYARVRAVTELRRDAFVVPQRAVTELQGLLQVAIVGEGDVVSMRVVEVGPRIGGDQVIEKGVAAGERVIVEGIQKVRDGATVRVRPAAPSAPAATPTSKD